jgi:hypothetical protein
MELHQLNRAQRRYGNCECWALCHRLDNDLGSVSTNINDAHGKIIRINFGKYCGIFAQSKRSGAR